MATDQQLEILHDHYKETFARILQVEKSRDRLFLWVIALFALLALEIAYPAAVGGALGKVTILEAEINLQAVPMAALLDATWILTLAIAMRYCQGTVFVHRQYDYLHMLEENISPLVRGSLSDQQAEASPLQALHPDIYRREGKVYLNRYPIMLNVVWIAYVFIFPFTVIVATAWLIYTECTQLPYPLPHLILDVVIALAIGALFLFYRILPEVLSKWAKFRAWRADLVAHKAPPKARGGTINTHGERSAAPNHRTAR